MNQFPISDMGGMIRPVQLTGKMSMNPNIPAMGGMMPNYQNMPNVSNIPPTMGNMPPNMQMPMSNMPMSNMPTMPPIQKVG